MGRLQKEMGSGRFRSEDGFPCRPFLFCEKETVRTPKKKAAQTFAEHFCLRRRKILLSTRRSAFGADMFPSGAPAPCIPGGRPEGGQMRPESTARYRRRRAGERPTFSHRSPAPGGDERCSSLSKGPFSLAVRNRFFLGPSKKKWVRRPLSQGQVFLADPFFAVLQTE